MFNEELEKRIDEALEYLTYDSNKSLMLFKQILTDNPGNVRAINGKCSALLKLNKYDQAEKCLKKSLNMEQTASAYINMGMVEKYKQNYEEALNCYDKAISINNYLDNIVTLLKNEVHKSINRLKKENIIKELDSDVQLLIKDGRKYQKDKKYWDAISCYELAIKRDNKCKLLLDTYMDEIKEIIQKELIFNEDIFIDEETGKLKNEIVGELIKDNNQTQDLTRINEVLSINEKDLDALNMKGIILFNLDDYDGALTCFDKCIINNRYYLYAYYNKIIVLRRLKKCKEAKFYVKQLRHFNNSSPTIKFNQEVLDEKIDRLIFS